MTDSLYQKCLAATVQDRHLPSLTLSLLSYFLFLISSGKIWARDSLTTGFDFSFAKTSRLVPHL